MSMVEVPPEACSVGHAWGPPVDGTVRMLIGWRPCSCPGARNGGHRTVHCERPGCSSPWWFDSPHDEVSAAAPYGRGELPPIRHDE